MSDFGIVVVGPPCAGKGTATIEVCKNLPGAIYVSTGDLLTDAMNQKGELADRIRARLSAGQLADQADVMAVFKERINAEPHGNGNDNYFLLDGMPRRASDACLADTLLGMKAVLHFTNVSDDELLRRQASRVREMEARGLQRRIDDSPDVIKERLVVYRDVTLKVLDHYRGRVPIIDIDASLPKDAVYLAVHETVRSIVRPVENSAKKYSA